MTAFCQSEGLAVSNITYAPVSKKKNIEYLVLLKKSGKTIDDRKITETVEKAYSERSKL